MKRRILTLGAAIVFVVAAYLFLWQKNKDDVYAYIPNTDEDSISVVDTISKVITGKTANHVSLVTNTDKLYRYK